MLIPDIGRGRVVDAKVGYLLDPLNGKGGFWRLMGYRPSNPGKLRTDLLRHAQENQVTRTTPVSWGTYYTVEAPMATPSGRIPLIRSVWIIDSGAQLPRLVSAFPP